MKKNKGFTLAEALLTMTVMGVVAALLIPTVVSDVRENANKAKAMALKVDLSGALSKMVMLENYNGRICCLSSCKIYEIFKNMFKRCK